LVNVWVKNGFHNHQMLYNPRIGDLFVPIKNFAFARLRGKGRFIHNVVQNLVFDFAGIPAFTSRLSPPISQ